jgi:hypothetical protein
MRPTAAETSKEAAGFQCAGELRTGRTSPKRPRRKFKENSTLNFNLECGNMSKMLKCGAAFDILAQEAHPLG